ncbi:hypothetical protein [Phytohabitans aurantiacus]|uniref:Core-binding (CB) domain-containing protein n=1 Tax=Phytohabitans aurantiacus TaxID=3016789 RepID=A0ABQ5QP21_9ACTN|nr:hypothetical protein [Phytohabitans aurantiacus]GLH95592.1 hypothetical protein Pa4123_08640 [Phytohabitans aurantiacus]
MRSSSGSQYFFKRSGCPAASACPRLRRPNGTWNPGHGSWHYLLELPPGEAGCRRQIRRGGYPSHRAALAARDHARALLALAAGDPTATADVTGLILATRRGRPLPPVDAVRTRLKGRRALAGTTTLGVYLDRWLGHRPVDANTRRTYAGHIHAHLVPRLGGFALNRLRPDDIRHMFTAIEAANERIRAARRSTSPVTRASVKGRQVTGPATCQRIPAVLRVALNDAVADGLIPTNPATLVRLRPARRAGRWCGPTHGWTAGGTPARCRDR